MGSKNMKHLKLFQAMLRNNWKSCRTDRELYILFLRGVSLLVLLSNIGDWLGSPFLKLTSRAVSTVGLTEIILSCKGCCLHEDQVCCSAVSGCACLRHWDYHSSLWVILLTVWSVIERERTVMMAGGGDGGMKRHVKISLVNLSICAGIMSALCLLQKFIHFHIPTVKM